MAEVLLPRFPEEKGASSLLFTFSLCWWPAGLDVASVKHTHTHTHTHTQSHGSPFKTPDLTDCLGHDGKSELIPPALALAA